MVSIINTIKDKVMNEKGISREEADKIVDYIKGDAKKLEELFTLTEEIRKTFFGNKIRKCTDGFTSNSCANSCSFCYMSDYKGKGGKTNRQFSQERGILPKVLKTPEEFVEDAKEKEALGATQYKIVGPEFKLPREHFELALNAYRAIKKETNLGLCASMGCLSKEELKKLKEVDVENFNHNLERMDWSGLNSVFTLKDKIGANKLAKEAGLKRCTGLIAGMGEDLKERIDIIFELQKLDVESLPFNLFVSPRPEFDKIVKPSEEEILLSLSICRLALPKAHIIINNGNIYFKDSWEKAFRAGASGFGLKGPKDRPCFLPHGRVENDYAFEALKKMGLE